MYTYEEIGSTSHLGTHWLSLLMQISFIYVICFELVALLGFLLNTCQNTRISTVCYY